MATTPATPKTPQKTPQAPPQLTKGEKKLVARAWQDYEPRVDALVAYLLAQADQGYKAFKTKLEAYLAAK